MIFSQRIRSLLSGVVRSRPLSALKDGAEGIRFNRPYLTGRENRYMAEALRRGHCSGNGDFSRECEKLLQAWFSSSRVFLTPSGTAALELAAYLININPGDEVIVPSFTFVSTANAFVSRGAKPVFADVDPETLNLDPDDVAAKITRRTRVIVPVHYGGVACEMEPLVSLSEERGITLIEDNSHGLFGTYWGRPLGTFGALSTISFHETKNFTCGEGGALVIRDPALVSRAEVLRDKGTDRARYFRGEVGAYTWQDQGANFLLSDVLAACLLAQLQAREQILSKRRLLWERYHRRLQEWAGELGVKLPQVPQGAGQTYHLFPLVFPSERMCRDFLEETLRRRVQSIFHYQPLSTSPMGRSFGSCPCPHAESLGGRLVRLPLYTGMTRKEQERVIRVVTEFGRSRPLPGLHFKPPFVARDQGHP